MIHSGLRLNQIYLSVYQNLLVEIAETPVKKYKDPVKAEKGTSRSEYPSERITVNLGAAHLPKSNRPPPQAIALSIFAAPDPIPTGFIDCYQFLGGL